jgi:hypothetical protein
MENDGFKMVQQGGCGIDLSREHEMAEKLDKLSDLNIPSGYLP